jgi:transcriptional regulator with XRE-family HTH domain
VSPRRNVERWEKNVVSTPAAAKRVAQIEAELRLATALTALREDAGMSQRQLADVIGVSQPRVAAIERSHNVTLQVLEKYVAALGGRLEVRVVKGKQSIALVAARRGHGDAGGARRRQVSRRADS